MVLGWCWDGFGMVLVWLLGGFGMVVVPYGFVMVLGGDSLRMGTGWFPDGIRIQNAPPGPRAPHRTSESTIQN